MWILTIPQVKAGGAGHEKRPSGEGVSASEMLTGGLIEPTLMEKWLLGAIRIPIAVLIELAAPAATNVTAKVDAKLRIGGDLVWAGSQEASELFVVADSGELVRTANVVLGETLPVPIEYLRGRQMELEITVEANIGVERLEATASATANTSNISPALIAGDAGAIQYDIQTLSGHRAL
jgi:hypothetical protein